MSTESAVRTASPAEVGDAIVQLQGVRALAHRRQLAFIAWPID